MVGCEREGLRGELQKWAEREKAKSGNWIWGRVSWKIEKKFQQQIDGIRRHFERKNPTFRDEGVKAKRGDQVFEGGTNTCRIE